jgi:hypothetical protein
MHQARSIALFFFEFTPTSLNEEAVRDGKYDA